MRWHSCGAPDRTWAGHSTRTAPPSASCSSRTSSKSWWAKSRTRPGGSGKAAAGHRVSAARYLSASIPLRVAGAGASVVLPILAVQRLHDVAIGGGLVAASLAPSVIVAPLVGVVLDRSRHPRWWIAASGLISAIDFAMSGFLGSVPLCTIFLALIVSGAASPFFLGGLSSFVPDGF